MSAQTVSRVINNKAEVSPETRKRVLRIIEEMGYQTNALARGLATRETKTIGLVIPDIMNPYFTGITRGVEDAANQRGYNVILCNSDEKPEKEITYLRLLQSKQVDGIIVCSSRLEDERLSSSLSRSKRVVLVNREPVNTQMGSVMVDNQGGAAAAVSHLIDLGHARIGYLNGRPTSNSTNARLSGYKETLRRIGLAQDPELVVDDSPDINGGHRAAIRLLRLKKPPTAMLCFNDLMAVGALRACLSLGRAVPDQMSVVGLDGIQVSEVVTPPLTTIRVPQYDTGRQAMEALAKLLADESLTLPKVVVPTELVVRSSTGPCPNHA